MKNRNLLVITLLVLSVLIVGTVEAEATRVAVIGFDSDDSSWTDSRDREEDLLENITQMFNNKLAETAEYTVLSRSRMRDILEDVKFSRGKRPARSKMNQLRNRLNADLFAYGILEEIELEQIDEFRVGPIQFSEVEIKIELKVTMINAQNLRTTETFSSEGRASDTGINILGDDGERVRLNSASDNILNQAMERAVDNLVANIIANITGDEAVEEEPEEREIESEIVSVVGERLVINKGERNGIRVGQTGEIIRYRNSSLRVVGQAEVTEIDSRSAILEATQLNQEPQVGDNIIITVTEDTVESSQSKEPIETFETRDFTIEINEAVQDGNRVTIRGTAYAKTDNAELEISLGARSFYDEDGNRREITGRRVSMGGWTRTSSDVPSISDKIRRGEPKNISWSFTNVPEGTNLLERVDLWISTEHEGNVSLELRDLYL